MKKLIEFKNTNFSYNQKNGFNNLNMEIEYKDIITLIGPSGSGKTTLLKMLCNKLPNESIYFEGKNIKSCNINDLKRELVIVFDLPFKTKTIKSELEYFLRILNFSCEEIKNKISEITDCFSLNKKIDNSLDLLPSDEKYLIKILRYLIIMPKFIAIDNIFANISQKNKNWHIGIYGL